MGGWAWQLAFDNGEFSNAGFWPPGSSGARVETSLGCPGLDCARGPTCLPELSTPLSIFETYDFADRGGRESRLPGERRQPREAYISQAHQSGDHRAWVSAAAPGSSSRVVGISLQCLSCPFSSGTRCKPRNSFSIGSRTHDSNRCVKYPP